jgi:hypothetical protein
MRLTAWLRRARARAVVPLLFTLAIAIPASMQAAPAHSQTHAIRA